MSPRHHAIRADGFCFTYPTQDEQALSDLSFEVSAGEVLGVVGPVEAGKTTLSMALSSFAPQNTGGVTDGDLSVAGRDPRDASDNAVAMVFEDYAAQLTQVHVLDEVVAPLVNRGIPRSDAIERARDLLDRVRLSVPDRKFTWELSGGQQQRLAIAAALAIDPDVLVFDTATDMLDPAGRELVSELIASLAGNTTLVVTANDPDELVGIADRLLVLEDGAQVTFGPAEDLLRDTDLLSSVGVKQPVCPTVAEDLGLTRAPLTPQAVVDALDAEDSLPSGDREAVIEADGDGMSTASARGERLLAADGVTYRYGSDTVAVDDVDFAVHAGEVHAVVGGNGAGKTTFTKLLSGLFEPDEGTVYVDGEPTDGQTAREVAESVGVALQNPDEQISEQTVRDELRFPLERRQTESAGFLGLSTRQRYDDAFVESRVEEVRSTVGIPTEEMESDPMFLPRGRRRQVTIGCALAPDPDVLVLDEPVAGVDREAQTNVTNAIERICADGKGVVLVDHDMSFVCSVADRVTVLDDGEIAMQGPTEQVFGTDNWEWLSAHHLRPPLPARLADRIGVGALTTDELVTAVQCRTGVSQ